MNVIKVGKYRINLALVAYVTERQSRDLQLIGDNWTENSYAKAEDRESGLVVDVTFCAMGSEYDLSLRLYKDEAERFLQLYDTLTIDIKLFNERG